MDITEYRQKLRQFDLTDNKLCDFIFIKTNAVIKPKHIRSAFERGTLSEPMTATIRFAFMELENAGKD